MNQTSQDYNGDESESLDLLAGLGNHIGRLKTNRAYKDTVLARLNTLSERQSTLRLPKPTRRDTDFSSGKSTGLSRAVSSALLSSLSPAGKRGHKAVLSGFSEMTAMSGQSEQTGQSRSSSEMTGQSEAILAKHLRFDSKQYPDDLDSENMALMAKSSEHSENIIPPETPPQNIYTTPPMPPNGNVPFETANGVSFDPLMFEDKLNEEMKRIENETHQRYEEEFQKKMQEMIAFQMETLTIASREYEELNQKYERIMIDQNVDADLPQWAMYLAKVLAI